MGHDLYRMILNGATAEWNEPMRLVALVIADSALDPRQSGDGPPGDGGRPWTVLPIRGRWHEGEWQDGLAERTGMSERAISRALGGLAAAGYEMRVAIGTDRRGRPVFAVKGHRTKFRVPLLPPRPIPAPPLDGQSPPDVATFEPVPGSAKGRQIRRQRSPHMAQRSPNSATQIPPGDPYKTPTAKSSAVNSPVEGSQGALDQDPDFSGDEGKGTCPACGQRVELMDTMNGPAIRNHDRDRDGEAYCPGTGQPPAGAAGTP